MRTFLKFKTSWDLKVPKHIWVKKNFECVKFGPKVPFWILVNLQFKNGYYKNWEFWNTIFCMFSLRQRVAWIFKVICRQVLIDGMSINWWFPQRTIWSFWANRVPRKKCYTYLQLCWKPILNYLYLCLHRCMYAWNNGMSYQGDKSHCSADPSQHNSTTIMDIFYNAWGSLRPTLTPFFKLFS